MFRLKRLATLQIALVIFAGSHCVFEHGRSLCAVSTLETASEPDHPSPSDDNSCDALGCICQGATAGQEVTPPPQTDLHAVFVQGSEQAEALTGAGRKPPLATAQLCWQATSTASLQEALQSFLL